MNFKTLIKSGFVVLDGAMGTMLQKRGLKTGEIPELINLEHPDVITQIHKEYIQAGANIVYANTFGCNSRKMAGSGHTVEQIIQSAIQNAKNATQGTNALVALDIGPIGELLEPSGTLSFEDAYAIFKEQVTAGVAAGADLVVVETMTDLYEMKAALLAVKENSTLPLICTMTFEEGGRTFTGCSISAMAVTLEGLGADAIGINCSLGPREIYPIAQELSRWTTLPLVVKPNAGLPDPNSGAYDIDADSFADSVFQMTQLGVTIMGGCCGTSPEYITAICCRLKGKTPCVRQVEALPVISSASKTVTVNQVRIIGERINPTGKKLFKEALKNQDMDYILAQGLQQCQAGADILDVNVGLPDIDEKQMMVRVIKALQGVIDVPLQIDSSDPAVIEAALRAYNGKAIVNSVNGEPEVLQRILPVVKKYGAAVVGLTLDKSGIPKKAKQRFLVAKKIVDAAMKEGIRKEDVYIDCLTLTASAEQEAVVETLKAVRMVKEQLGVRTVLGVSNISFGLPNRELVNHTFLTLAMANGLDLPIINPNIGVMMDAVRAFRLLTNVDKDAKEYVAVYGQQASQDTAQRAAQPQNHTLDYAVEKGLKEECGRLAHTLLATTDPMEIINTMLIPALDRVGTDFEKGIVFLPQLIQAAGAAGVAFDAIKAHLLAKGEQQSVSKGTVVLATVKGDIHDIGKNIVKVLLENYGYHVVDLGRDVDYMDVVKGARDHKADIVGLSALMTTTLKSMEETIRVLRENGVKAKIVVGGAVLTEEYAGKIGADFYAKDAKESVDIAKRILG